MNKITFICRQDSNDTLEVYPSETEPDHVVLWAMTKHYGVIDDQEAGVRLDPVQCAKLGAMLTESARRAGVPEIPPHRWVEQSP